MSSGASTDSLYEQVLRALGGGASPPSKPPRASAAVVPWRVAGRGLEVYWVKRSPELAFMGGWHAFPGGSIAREDAGVAVDGAPVGLASADDAPGLSTGALRELFEETGLLPSRTAAPSPEALARARARLLAGQGSWPDLLAELGATPSADELVYAGRWLTPPFGPLRFDNRFFLLEWPADRAAQPSVVPGELVAGEWVRPGEARARWEAGEALAAPPVLFFLDVLEQDGLDAFGARGLTRLREARETFFGEFRRIEFRPATLAFPVRSLTLPPAGTTNCILLGTGETVVIDPGCVDPQEQRRLAEALVEVTRRTGRRLTEIWLTHHHPDHVAGVEALRAALGGVPVRAHALTAKRLRESVRVDEFFADEQRVVLAGDPPTRVRVLHTPGHARGHLCFLDEDRGTLIAGDLVSALGTVVIDPPEGDMDAYLESLERMRALAPRTLIPAHGSAVLDPGRVLAEVHAHRLAREQRVLDAWQTGLREPEAMIDLVYDDTPGAARPLAARQIRAHLERLERMDRLG